VHFFLILNIISNIINKLYSSYLDAQSNVVTPKLLYTTKKGKLISFEKETKKERTFGLEYKLKSILLYQFCNEIFIKQHVSKFYRLFFNVNKIM